MQTRFAAGDEHYRFARPTDLAAIFSMLADPEVGRWLWFVPAPEAALRSYFRPLIDAQWQSLADATPPSTAVFVVEDAQGAFLGQGATVAVEGSAGGFEIGYQLPREAWGRGVGLRLAEFLVAWAVRNHGAHRIQAGCLAGNAGSRRLLERLGLVLEGTRPEYRCKGDVRHDECEYGILVRDLDPALLARVEARVQLEDR